MTVFLVFLFCSLVMAITWYFARRIDNYGIVDIAWSALFTPVVVFYYLALENHFRHFFLVFIVACWSLRLASHLLFRIAKEHPKEDGRYQTLRQKFGNKTPQNMFWLFQAQAVLVVLLSVPFYISLADHSPAMNTFHAVATTLWLISLWGEALADKQLRDFKSKRQNKGQTCRQGLWKYSRHPNYFFEWLIWVSYAIFAMGSPWGWIALYCPAFMLYTLLKVTGIPATEEQSLKSRGDDYRRYQESTSMFFPWFPKGHS